MKITTDKLIEIGFEDILFDSFKFKTIKIGFCDYTLWGRVWKVYEINGNRLSIELNSMEQLEHLIKGVYGLKGLVTQ